MVKSGSQERLRWSWSTSALPTPARPWSQGSSEPHRTTATASHETELTWWQQCSWGFLWPPPLLRDTSVAVAGGAWVLQATNPHCLTHKPFLWPLIFPVVFSHVHAFAHTCSSPRVPFPLIRLSHLKALTIHFRGHFLQEHSPAPQPISWRWFLPTVVFYGTLPW